jgi:hypothetical protein
LHNIFIALCELWNTRNIVDTTLPWGKLDGCRFGLNALQKLLDQAGCDSCSKSTSAEIEKKIFDAISTAEVARRAKRMAEFVRWATETYMDFLDSHRDYMERTAALISPKLSDVQNRLLANTSEVDKFLQLNNSDREVRFRIARMLQILHSLFKAIIDHHQRVPNFRIGVEQVLLLAEESDFINRRTKNYLTLHKIFAADEAHGLPMDQRLSRITLAVGKQIKQRGYQMPLEYAVRTVSPVIPGLHYAVLDLLPLHNRSDWFYEVGLHQIGEELASDVDARLYPQRFNNTPSTPIALGASTTPSVYETARSRQPDPVARIATKADPREPKDPSSDESRLDPQNTDLRGSRHQTTQHALVASLEDHALKLTRPALAPTLAD